MRARITKSSVHLPGRYHMTAMIHVYYPYNYA